MNSGRREFLLKVAALAGLGLCSSAYGNTRLPRIGFLAPSPQTYQEAFRKGLRELGYVEGRNLIVEYRFSGGRDDRLAEYAEELVKLGVAAIVVSNSSGTAAAMRATRTVPIVMVTSGDPVGSGFIKSFARPGGNVTGLSSLAHHICIKQMELLKEAAPAMKHAAVIFNPYNDPAMRCVQTMPQAASALDLRLDFHEVRAPGDVPATLQAIGRSSANGLIVLVDQVANLRRKEIAAFAVERRMPSMHAIREYADDGGLMAYGVSFADLHYRAANYVHRILGKASPAELPVEQPRRFELALNLRAAREIGLTLTREFIVRADHLVQ